MSSGEGNVGQGNVNSAVSGGGLTVSGRLKFAHLLRCQLGLIRSHARLHRWAPTLQVAASWMSTVSVKHDSS